MKTAPLGRSGLSLPRIGLGGAPLGREINEEESWDILDYATSNGITLIDTAESYGGGNAQVYRKSQFGSDDVREVTDEMHSSEKTIGRWHQKRQCRDRIQICSKVSTGGTPENIARALNASLERLQTDILDIYMLHGEFFDVPIRETLEALDQEVKSGRIRTLGCSNFSLEALQEAQQAATDHQLTRFEVIQPPFSLADASARDHLLPYCVRESIATTTYSPLAAGFLTGKYSSSDHAIPKGTRFDIIPGHSDVYFSEKNFQIVEKLRQLSDEREQTMVQLAMQWVFEQPGVSSILVGARKRSHLDNALEALTSSLPPELKEEMDHWLD